MLCWKKYNHLNFHKCCVVLLVSHSAFSDLNFFYKAVSSKMSGVV